MDTKSSSSSQWRKQASKSKAKEIKPKMKFVSVRQLPETLGIQQTKRFLSAFEECVNVDRPRIVLDCSGIQQMNGSAIHILLCCLEEAMKRNGDVKLAAVPPEGREILTLTGADRLFEIFDTVEEAVEGFYRHGFSRELSFDPRAMPQLESENAA
jgi:anti-sigma B factor antagonist